MAKQRTMGVLAALWGGLVLMAGLSGQPARAAAADGVWEIQNGILTAKFDASGLVRLTDDALKKGVDFEQDRTRLEVDGEKWESQPVSAAGVRRESGRLVFTHDWKGRKVEVVYELKKGWRFVSKQTRVTFPAGYRGKVNQVTAFEARLLTPIQGDGPAGGRGGSRTGCAFLRLAGADGKSAGYGLFDVLQNPYRNAAGGDKNLIQAAYPAEMEWRAEYGPFETDRFCVGTYALSGVELPLGRLREWEYSEDPEKLLAERGGRADQNEIAAMTDCVRAFLRLSVEKSAKVHVGWCENDYQIDVGTPAGRTEYKRIIDQVSAMGFEHLLFGPANSQVSSTEESRDAWGWENVLWLGLGQKIRKGEWDPAKDPIPSSVQEMLSYAKSKKVKFLAYVYPTLGFMQNPEWTAWVDNKPGGYSGVDTGVRSYQDWLVDQLVAFSKKTGCSGFSFDHWWIAYDGRSTSKYAQWYGCRRILETLRERLPEVVIDGRQQYHWFGPWTWLAGSYPHPMMSDEQPGSYRNFPDMHFDRVSANRQRYAAWDYRIGNYCPVEILPGYMTHQTMRSDAQGKMYKTSFRARDWDYLGWKYSVISSIATAPLNHVLNMVPARDPAEMEAFSREDIAWFKNWIRFTDDNIQYMRKMRAIVGQPALGRVDGTAAVIDDAGFVFLFNPNYRKLDAAITLDGMIGLTQGARFTVRELYPVAGRLHGKPGAGLWNYGDKVVLPIKGPEALVLQIEPAGNTAEALLFNAAGEAALRGGNLVLEKVAGEPGQAVSLTVALPGEKKVESVTVNGKTRPFTSGNGTVTIPVRFQGVPFTHCQQIGSYDPKFAGKEYSAAFTVPGRVFAQLEARKKAWPVPFAEEDLVTPWLAPYRLLLFVQIGDPNPEMAVGMKIDGQPVEVVKSWGGVYPSSGKQTMTGFYADLSKVAADQEHRVEVTLPDGLKPGQFQGLFFENVEAAQTTDLAD